MTYEMRMKDLRNEAFYEGEAKGLAEGRAEGKSEGKFEAIKNLMSTLSCSIDKAMDMLKTPPEERQYFKDMLAKNL